MSRKMSEFEWPWCVSSTYQIPLPFSHIFCAWDYRPFYLIMQKDKSDRLASSPFYER